MVSGHCQLDRSVVNESISCRVRLPSGKRCHLEPINRRNYRLFWTVAPQRQDTSNRLPTAHKVYLFCCRANRLLLFDSEFHHSLNKSRKKSISSKRCHIAGEFSLNSAQVAIGSQFYHSPSLTSYPNLYGCGGYCEGNE